MLVCRCRRRDGQTMVFFSKRNESQLTIQMIPSIEVHSDLRIGDLYPLFFSNVIRKLFYARRIVVIVLIFLAALGTRYVALVARLLKPPFLYFLLGGLILVAVVLPYLRFRAFVQATMGTSSALLYTFGPEGVDVQRQGWQAHYDWVTVRNARQTSNLILVHVEGHSALVIPKRCFANSQQLNDVRSIIAAHIKSKIKQAIPASTLD